MHAADRPRWPASTGTPCASAPASPLPRCAGQRPGQRARPHPLHGPNGHLVFLHDTSARELFKRPARAYSEGCIRVERAHELAVLPLDDAERWRAQRLAEIIDDGGPQTLPLRRHVPLLLYKTGVVQCAMAGLGS
ncbi:L,D-transpeptidase family protein [Hydrogenophaga sp. 2FB]|uniref:L,D-transpeptidase family protein n=1 Tax=Ottowia caeni TaxID=2870339 RepID=UPI0014853A38|nr:L,D-transpeptidase family protein [Ottowia caeni]